jgi:lysophospholipase L1-like esterase
MFLRTQVWRFLLALVVVAGSGAIHAADERFDLVVYGGTSGGIAAAVQARRMGKTAVVVEPGKHLGGLSSGGLGATDIGNKSAIGGISREFYQRVKKHYADLANWKHQKREEYQSGRQSEKSQEDAMWTFEPHVAEEIFEDFCRAAGVVVVKKERLDLQNGVEKRDGRILSIRMESGRSFAGRMFVDATYEGDLMAKSGVSYTVGREANEQYGETLNGVQTKNATKHQFVPGVDPYVKKGDKSSGLLPLVHAGPPGKEGAADKRVQAYNLRLCLTDVKENQTPFTEPPGYDARRYELLLRNFEAGETRTPWAPVMMPNRKTDVNNNHGFSTDYIGHSYDWPEADHAAREKIFQEHLRYHQGFVWTLMNNPRVPERIRSEVSRWGLCKDEFHDFGGWPHQLYVREARRMVTDDVMTQHHCQGRAVADDAVGLAAYTMDSHNVQRYVDSQGQVRNEGDVQVGGFSPNPISNLSIDPRKSECANLLVPVCLAASHIAYGSIRMEPVFMVLGQSSATAAALAMDAGVSVQDVPYDALRTRLLADHQVLSWTREQAPTPPAKVQPLLVAQVAQKAAKAQKAKAPAAKKKAANPAYAQVEDVAGLPRVLIIGDSISIGYQVPLREALKGRANVHRPGTNCGPTTRGVENIEAWLGDGKWDVIHFNFGLHDVRHFENGVASDADKGQRQVSEADYEKNLEQLVTRMKKTGARLIFATTTPVPAGSAGRVPGDEVRYNEIARRVMQKQGVEIDDLYSFILPRLAEAQLPMNVHYKPEGSKLLADQVASGILKALNKN